MLRKFYEEHYRNWFDQLALGDRTARPAARSKTVRSKLIELLKDGTRRSANAARASRL